MMCGFDVNVTALVDITEDERGTAWVIPPRVFSPAKATSFAAAPPTPSTLPAYAHSIA